MKRNKPLLSVVMPAYNAEQYISTAIQSILTQTLTNFEFIIVDDSSTDKTRKIIESFAKNDSRINILTSADHNIARVLNKGIHSAKTNIIARMDADDVALPNRLESQFEIINTSESIAVVGSNIIIIDPAGNKVAVRKYPHESQELKKCLFRYSPFAHPVVMFRKNIFDEVGGYNPKYSPTEDLDLWFRMGKKHTFASIPIALLQYRISPKSTSHKIIKDLEKMVFEIRLNAIKYHGYRPSLYDVSYNVFQYLTLWITPVKYRTLIYNLLRNNDLI